MEERARQTKKGSVRTGFKLRDVTAVAYSEIESQDDVRVSSGVTEFDRVLGGGIVPGTLVLIGGRSAQRNRSAGALHFRRRV